MDSVEQFIEKTAYDIIKDFEGEYGKTNIKLNYISKEYCVQNYSYAQQIEAKKLLDTELLKAALNMDENKMKLISDTKTQLSHMHTVAVHDKDGTVNLCLEHIASVTRHTPKGYKQCPIAIVLLHELFHERFGIGGTLKDEAGIEDSVDGYLAKKYPKCLEIKDSIEHDLIIKS